MSKIKNIYLFIFRKLFLFKNPLFKFSRKKQEKLIENLGTPNSDIERSFFQYKLQRKLKNYITTVIEDLISKYMIKKVIKNLKIITLKSTYQKNIIAINGDENLKKLIPDSIIKNIIFITNESKENILLEFQTIFNNLRLEYKKHPYFLLKILNKFIDYSSILNVVYPSEIICFSEYSFTSSIITHSLNNLEVVHTNVMHGEKLFFIRDSYFHFNKMYVWDAHYLNLFNKLKAHVDEYIVYLPEKHNINIESYNINYDFKYYLAGENVFNLLKISFYLRKLKNTGKKVGIRYHPIYKSIFIKLIFYGMKIENPKKINIEYSLLETKSIISLYSTVLLSAVLSNKRIYIDDLSNKGKFNKIKNLDYIIFSKKYDLLSNIIYEKKGG